MAKTVGERLRNLRREAGLTQDTLSAISGVDRATISMIERGEQKPWRRTLWRLATGFEFARWPRAWDELLEGDRSLHLPDNMRFLPASTGRGGLFFRDIHQ